MYHVNMFMTG